jgi:transposase
MSTKITATHERVDDIPAIIAHLHNMRVAPLLDTHFSPNGHWQGVSLGKTTGVWLAFILSEGDHRLYRVAPWVTAHQRTLSRCLGSAGKPRDLTDDRLATILDDLHVAERWGTFERDLTQSVRRVSDLQGRVVRIDTTTAGADGTPDGLCQLGPRKAHRPDLPQVKIAMAVLDPLGLPLTMTVVAGQTADAPLSVPEMATVRQTPQRPGLTEVGDCTMAALGTRAESVAHQDDSWCPLSAKQRPEAELARVLDPVFRGVLAPSALRLPNADGALDETDDPVAMGFVSPVELMAPAHSGPSHTWQERRLVVRSLACAARQEKPLRQRVTRAVTALNALAERQQGKPRVPDAATAGQAAAAILAQHRVAGLVTVTVTTAVHAYVKRRYGTRPATTVRSERVRVGATCEEAPLAHAVRRLGWRVSATNHAAEAVSRAQGVAASRREYLIEQGFGRLKGRAWSLTPLFLRDEQRVVALSCLLSIALRVLVLMPCVVRRHLRLFPISLRESRFSLAYSHPYEKNPMTWRLL